MYKIIIENNIQHVNEEDVSINFCVNKIIFKDIIRGMIDHFVSAICVDYSTSNNY